MDINNTTFINYLEKIIKNITNNDVKNYFKFNDDQKLTVIYSVFTQLKTNQKITIVTNDLKTLIVILCKKCEKDENYELASILNSILKKYENLTEVLNNKISEIKNKKIEKF